MGNVSASETSPLPRDSGELLDVRVCFLRDWPVAVTYLAPETFRTVKLMELVTLTAPV